MRLLIRTAIFLWFAVSVFPTIGGEGGKSKPFRWPYPHEFYVKWTHRELNKVLDADYGVKLSSPEPNWPKPDLREIPQSALNEIFDEYYGKSYGRRPQSALLVENNEVTIFLTKERVAAAEVLLAHEYVHYLFFYSKFVTTSAGPQRDAESRERLRDLIVQDALAERVEEKFREMMANFELRR